MSLNPSEGNYEKGKITHSSILAWRIPWIQSMGLQSRTLLSDFQKKKSLVFFVFFLSQYFKNYS